MAKLTEAQRRILVRLCKRPTPPEFLSFGELLSIETALLKRGLVRRVARTLHPSWVVWLLFPKCHGWSEAFAITPAGRAILEDRDDG